MISMLASGSWNDGAGSPPCSMAPAIRSTVESILAHFADAQAPREHRYRGVHAAPLAARAAARARRVSALRRSALAARSPRARGLAGCVLAPRSPSRIELDPRAWPVSSL